MGTDHSICRPVGPGTLPVPAFDVWALLLAALASAVLLGTAGCKTAPADGQEDAASGAATVVPTGRLREFSVTAYCTGTSRSRARG